MSRYYLHIARLRVGRWAADPLEQEADRLDAVRHLFAAFHDPTTPPEDKVEVLEFFREESDRICRTSRSPEKAIAAYQQLLLGEKRSGAQRGPRCPDRDWAIAEAVREKRRSGVCYEQALADAANRWRLSRERVRNIDTALRRPVAAEAALRADRQAFLATMPERWADFLDELRASDDGMVPSPIEDWNR